MWFKPWRRVRPAYQALAGGRQDEAFDWLERAFLRRQQAHFQLQLAAVYALFDDRGKQRGEAALARAVIFNRSIVQDSLYQALQIEFAVLSGKSDQELKRQLRTLLTHTEDLAKFHVARALYKMGSYKTAGRALLELENATLPQPLQARRLLMLAQSYVARGKEQEAVDIFEQVLKQLKNPEKMLTELALAESYLRLAQPAKAILVLNQTANPPEKDVQLIRKRYLEGVTYRHLGKYEEAFHKLHEAYNSIVDQGDAPFEILLEMARLFVDLGKVDNALKSYQQAFSVVTSEQYNMLMHEYGSLLKQQEDYAKAKEILQLVVKDVRYPKRVLACAELAMVEYKLGHFELARALASYALDNGQVVLASLCLGNIALEYFRYAEAETYFEQALAEAPEGNGQWLTAQLMLAQTFAQKKLQAPEKLIFHAEQALKYLHPNDAWVITLRQYISHARDSLSEGVSNLN